MKRHLTLYSVIVAACVLIIGGVISLVARQSAIGQTTADLIAARLVTLGVQVKSVRVTGVTLLNVEITYVEERTPTQISDKALWDGLLVEHVAKMAYIDGATLGSYTVIEVDPTGKEISKGTAYLRSDQMTGLLKVDPTLPPLDDTATQTRLTKRFNTYGLPIKTLSVSSGGAARTNTQVIELILVSSSLQDTNKVINQLVPSVLRDTRMANSNGDARIAILRFKVLDSEGTLLMHYLLDLEAGVEMFTFAPGVNAEWFPHPLSTSPTPTSPLSSPLQAP
jgi:hypothetical protein